MRLGARNSAIQGTVTLVALCFITVLGITLAGYIAVCSRAMNLSNRTYQDRTTLRLAEMGIDEALRAFNKNNWSDWSSGGVAADWTLSGTTATCNLTFPANKFGQGVTGSVKIRVDNYNANQLDSTWNSGLAYRVNELVGDGGIWYRCIKAHTSNSSNRPVNWNYWVPEGIPWMWSSTKTYAVNDLIVYNEVWYRCKAVSLNNTPPNTTYWKALEGVYTIFPAYPYVSVSGNEALLISSGILTGLGWQNSNTGQAYNWSWSSGTYAFNDVVYTNGWYRCIIPHTSSGNPNSDSKWAAVTSMWNWSSSLSYNLGDVVYYTNQWYRCILAHTSSISLTPNNATYWTNAPLYSTAWDPNRQYSQNDTVRYNGVWYRYINGTASSSNLPTNTTYWIGANTSTASYQWNSATAYSVGSYRCYEGVWYKCIAATTANAGNTPNNPTYWTASWANSFGVTTGAPVIYSEGTITIAGNPSIKSQLRAIIAPTPLFPNAVASTTTLTASTSTSSATVDSYDGSVNTMTAAGTYSASLYSTSTNISYSAVLAASNPGSATNFNINNTSVKGYIAAPSASTTPFAPLWTKSGSAILTGVASGTGVDLTRVSRSPNIPQFTTLPISGTSSPTSELAAAFSAANFPKGIALYEPTTPASGNTVNIGTPGATTPSRYYYNGNLTINDTASIQTLNINGPVILYISGNLILDGNGTAPDGTIHVNPTGSAEIHIGDSLDIRQNSDGIRNYTYDPKRLILICDTTASSIQRYGDGGFEFYGTIYMPNTSNSSGLNFNNTVSPTTATYAVYGAISAKKVTYDKNMNVHYDTSLRYATFGGVDQPYTVTDWRELSSDEEATMP